MCWYYSHHVRYIKFILGKKVNEMGIWSRELLAYNIFLQTKYWQDKVVITYSKVSIKRLVLLNDLVWIFPKSLY